MLVPWNAGVSHFEPGGQVNTAWHGLISFLAGVLGGGENLAVGPRKLQSAPLTVGTAIRGLLLVLLIPD